MIRFLSSFLLLFFVFVSPAFAVDFTASNVVYIPAKYPNAALSFDYSGISPDMENVNSVLAVYDTLNMGVGIGYGYYVLGDICSAGHCELTFNGEGIPIEYIRGHDFVLFLNYGTGDKFSQEFILGHGMNEPLQAEVITLLSDFVAGAFTIIVAAVGIVGGYWITKKLVQILLNWFHKFS